MEILWIDDDEHRQQKCDYINKNTEHNAQFQLLNNEVAIDNVLKIALGKKYNIIIIDECFTKISNIINHGSLLPNILLTHDSKAFFVGITADINKEVIKNDYLKSPYHIFLEESSFYDKFEELIALANDYNFLTTKTKSIARLFPNIFKKENYSRELDLKSVIPQSILKNYSSINSKKILFQWVYNVLLKRAGFLYDEIWLATFLGIKGSSLHKIEKYFKSAKYEGLFNSNKKLWWIEDIKDLLFSSNVEFSKSVDGIVNFWERGRLIKGISEKDYSKCEVTGNDHPEYVAYKDSSLNEIAQIKYEYTEPVDIADNIKYYEEIRVFNDDLL